jgi:septal ring-binding cell division protein DamX
LGGAVSGFGAAVLAAEPEVVLNPAPVAGQQVDVLAPEAIGDPPDIIEIRLAATRDWLTAPGASQYSIQVMTLKSDLVGKLNNYLSELPKTIELNDIFVYKTRIGGKTMYGVLYQAFDTRAGAQARLRDMPESFRSFEPFLLRTVEGLRSEIARSDS